jgi:uncharacterized glyoxalase superfamily protein PhnB
MSHKPEGWPDVIPRIFVDEPIRLYRFMLAVFGATADVQPGAPIEARIGDSLVMISDTSVREPLAACLYVYVPDVDRAYRTALQEGAESLEEVRDTPYGDRRAMVRDPWGNAWQIATRH